MNVIMGGGNADNSRFIGRVIEHKGEKWRVSHISRSAGKKVVYLDIVNTPGEEVRNTILQLPAWQFLDLLERR